jgi:TolB-like protein
MTSFLGELRRRNVVKVAVAYAIVGWLLIEVSSTVLPIFEAPAWIVQVFSFFVLLGFPLALILSWVYEITPDGVERTESVATGESITPATGTKLNVAIIGLLVVAVAFMYVDNYVLDAPRPPFAGAEVDPASLEAPLDEPPTAAATVVPPPPAADEQPTAPLTAIAVLPFDNLSPDPENSYFASGMHEEILNSLAKLSALDVKSRTSVLRYAENKPPIEEIAAELNVGSVLEGSVRFANNRVRVTTQLIDAASGNHLWSETYEHEFEDIFAIESDVAMNIANALEAEFSDEEQQSIYTPRTDSPEALALFWQAEEVSYGMNRTESLPLLDRAIAIDPEFGAAYAVRAYSRAVDPSNIEIAADPARLEALETAILQDVSTALTIDSDLGSAHVAEALIHERHRRGADALAAYERAYDTFDGPAVLWIYSRFLASAGQFTRAVELAEEALELDPTIAGTFSFLGDALFFVGEQQQAEATHLAYLEAAPTGRANFQLGRLYAIRGDADEALTYLRIEDQLRPALPQSSQLAMRAMSYSLIDRPEDAMRLFRILEERHLERQAVDGLVMATAYLAIGNRDEALSLLRDYVADNDRIIQLGDQLALAKYNFWNLPVLEEPEFVEVRQQLGFTDL